MEFLKDTQSHDDVVDAYKTYNTSDVTAAMYRDSGSAWRPAHSDMFTGVAREIAVNYLGSFASAESIAQPHF
jgi:hypothetical protein